MGIHERKKEHVRITTEESVNYDRVTGFDRFYFRHKALPELDLESVNTEARLLDRTFAFPLFISSMTGGHVEAGSVNAIIAALCEKYDLPFGVGSQRILLEDSGTEESFNVVRKEAPNAFIASNIGGAQLIDGLDKKAMNRLIDSIEADAVIVHLNPLQELMQPEGDRNFEGIADGIESLARQAPVPILVKETGAGINGQVARRLIRRGVAAIDVAGAGGTSWAKVENRRSSREEPDFDFDNWGIPTIQCLREVNALEQRSQIDLIASGGIRSSFDIAKALCLGADFAAAATPIIQAISAGGYDRLEQLYAKWVRQCRHILLLLGCASIDELSEDDIAAELPRL